MKNRNNNNSDSGFTEFRLGKKKEKFIRNVIVIDSIVITTKNYF